MLLPVIPAAVHLMAMEAFLILLMVKSLIKNDVKNSADGRLKISITNIPTSEVFSFSLPNTGTTTILHYDASVSSTAE